MANVRPSDLPLSLGVAADAAIIVDNGTSVDQATPLQIVDAARPIASQAEAEAGADNTKLMTALRVSQSIAANGGGGTIDPTTYIPSQSVAEAGTDNTKFMTPLRVKQAITVGTSGYATTSALGAYATTSALTAAVSGLVTTSALSSAVSGLASYSSLIASTGASLVSTARLDAGAVTRTVRNKLNESYYSTGDYTTLPTVTTPDGWYIDLLNSDGAGKVRLKSNVPSTVSMVGGGGVQGVANLVEGEISAATPNPGFAETNLYRSYYTIKAAAGPNLQVHTHNHILVSEHNVGTSGNEGAIYLGTMQITGPAAGGSNVANGGWAGDLHVEKKAGVASGKMVGLEVGVHSDVTQTYGVSTSRQNGIEVWSGPRGVALTGVKAHDALSIFGTGGWTNYLNFLHTDNVFSVFKLDATGNLTCKSPTGDIVTTFKTSTSNTTATLQVTGRTAGGTDVQFAIQSNGGGLATIGTASNHSVSLMSNGTAIATFGVIRMAMAVPLQMKSYTVATLPTGQAGDRAFVTDANAATFNTAAAAGGTNKVPVFHDGTVWRIG